MLNDKHDDLLLIKERENLNLLHCDFPRSFENSTLLNTKFMNQLENSSIGSSSLHGESCSQQSQSSQILDFENSSELFNSKGNVETEEETRKVQPQLVKILDMLALEESNDSIQSIIDYTKMSKARRCPLRANKSKVKDFSKTENLLQEIDQELKTFHASKPEAKLQKIQRVSKLKERLIKQSQDFEKNDITEHPSVNDSKALPNSTKERYRKYMTKKRSASRGVFEYNDSESYPTTPLGEVQNKHQTSRPAILGGKLALQTYKYLPQNKASDSKTTCGRKNLENVDPSGVLNNELGLHNGNRNKDNKKSDSKARYLQKNLKSSKKIFQPKDSARVSPRVMDTTAGINNREHFLNLKRLNQPNSSINSISTCIHQSNGCFSKRSITASNCKKCFAGETTKLGQKQLSKRLKRPNKSNKRTSSLEACTSPAKITRRRTSGCLVETKLTNNSKSRGDLKGSNQRKSKVRVYLRSLYDKDTRSQSKYGGFLPEQTSMRGKYSAKSIKKQVYASQNFKSFKSSTSRSRHKSKSPINSVMSKSCRPSPGQIERKSYLRSSQPGKIKGILKNKSGKSMKNLKSPSNFELTRNSSTKATKRVLKRMESTKDYKKSSRDFLNPSSQTIANHTPKTCLGQSIKAGLKDQDPFFVEKSNCDGRSKVKRFKKNIISGTLQSLKTSRVRLTKANSNFDRPAGRADHKKSYNTVMSSIFSKKI
ncbi:unnamed protein product [Moneuplotes crassus]|uniref:Uncharacterized protein n=1 Tax=Euplotes crassus TaxID=5936 RepID=A0AAD2D669_EUPCR|nr:unnamed protein product [Moneuplotes crassus]